MIYFDQHQMEMEKGKNKLILGKYAFSPLMACSFNSERLKDSDQCNVQSRLSWNYD